MANVVSKDLFVKKSKLRTVNGYILFRKYYSIPFTDRNVEQKITSRLVSDMWKYDLNKSIWAILGKAYSTIRDYQGKEDSPLEEFVHHIIAILDLPEHDDYVDHFTFFSLRDDTYACQPRMFLPRVFLNISVAEIIEIFVDLGWVSAGILVVPEASNMTQAAMNIAPATTN